MAYQVHAYGGYGDGSLGTVVNPAAQLNSYANVTAFDASTITIGTPSVGTAQFVVGAQVMVHASASLTGAVDYLGCYAVVTINEIAGSVITIDKDLTSVLMPTAQLPNYHVQAIAVAQFESLSITGATILAPPAYNVSNKYGGILAIKCKNTFSMVDSARIDLVGKGIPIGSVALRPATVQEGEISTKFGWENHITSRRLMLNCPDGAVFIIAKNFSNWGVSTRIGGSSAGTTRYPHSGDPSTTAVKGGPSICLIAKTITDFSPSLVSKASSNTSGRGMGRCYVASESRLPADELLYALDCISTPSRLQPLRIIDYGTGALGNSTGLSGQVNSYAPISNISENGKTISIGTIYAGNYETFLSGKTVMFHVSRQLGANGDFVGKFILLKIVSVSGSDIEVDVPITNVFPTSELSNYNCQLLTVAQFDQLIQSIEYTGAKAYNETHGCGGIVAIMGKTSIDLQNGKINMTGKGIPKTTNRPTLLWQCSGKQGDCLPLSQGDGSIFLVTKKLTMNSTTRLGSLISGAAFCGVDVLGNNGTDAGAGYGGGPGWGGPWDTYDPYSYGEGHDSWPLLAGYGGTGKYSSNGYNGNGGVGGFSGVAGAKGTDSYGYSPPANTTGYGGDPGLAGGSLFIAADELIGFSITAIATGGKGGKIGAKGVPGGGFNPGGGGGGGGGGAGTCFIYANTITSPDYTAVLAN